MLSITIIIITILATLFYCYIFDGIGITTQQSSNLQQSTTRLIINSSSLDKIKESLFCPLRHPIDIDKYDIMIKDIYNLQFNDSCDYNSNTKYYIMDEHDYSYGMFSTIDNYHLRQFISSLATKRKFLIRSIPNKKWRYLPINNGKDIKKKCENRTGRDCVFKLVSNCNIQQTQYILKMSDKEKKTLKITPKICDNENIITMKDWINYTEKYKVIHFGLAFTAKCNLFKNHLMTIKSVSNFIIENTNYGNLTYFEFKALIISFLLRVHDNIQNIINKIVSNSLNKYKWKSIYKTLSFPIRGSDKCYRPGKYGEMRCNTMQKNIETIYKFKKRFNKFDNIDTIIITSEDEKIIEQYRNLSLYLNEFNFIFNDFDIMQSTGNPFKGFKNDKKKFNFTTDEVWLNILISMLSSLKLQMNSNYYVTRTRSNWINGIWSISSSINCQLWMNQTDDIIHFNISNQHKKHCKNFDIKGNEFEFDQHCYRENLNKGRNSYLNGNYI